MLNKLKGLEEQSDFSVEQERLWAGQVDQNNRIRNRLEPRVHQNGTLCLRHKKRSVDKHFGRGIEGFGEEREGQGAVRTRQKKNSKKSSQNVGQNRLQSNDEMKSHLISLNRVKEKWWNIYKFTAIKTLFSNSFE